MEYNIKNNRLSVVYIYNIGWDIFVKNFFRILIVVLLNILFISLVNILLISFVINNFDLQNIFLTSVIVLFNIILNTLINTFLVVLTLSKFNNTEQSFNYLIKDTLRNLIPFLCANVLVIVVCILGLIPFIFLNVIYALNITITSADIIITLLNVCYFIFYIWFIILGAIATPYLTLFLKYNIIDALKLSFKIFKGNKVNFIITILPILLLFIINNILLISSGNIFLNVVFTIVEVLLSVYAIIVFTIKFMNMYYLYEDKAI